MRRIVLVLVIVFSAINVGYAQCGSERYTKLLEKKYSYKIYCQFEPAVFFNPHAWGGFAYDLKGKQITRRDYRKALVSLERFSKKYPLDILKNNLREVYLAKELTYKGNSFGGSYRAGIILMSYDHHYDTIQFVEKEFHHEFSSILMKDRKNKFYRDVLYSWRRNSGKYYGSVKIHKVTWEDEDDGRGTSRELLKNGFLVKYGRTGYENDFNTYAETLFTTPRKIARYSKRYPKVKRKTKIIKEFYCKISNKFHFCEG